jgi:aminoglycoside phosphotransferase (APT) family kinase protein
VSDGAPAIDEQLARRLIDAQFPQWRDLAVAPVPDGGIDNRTFRLGDELSVRLPSADWYALQVEKEQRWLPVLAPLLPLPIPAPVAHGRPGEGYPYAWSVYRWLEGETASRERVTDLEAFATDLAAFLAALARAPVAGAPGPGPHTSTAAGRSPTTRPRRWTRSPRSTASSTPPRRAPAGTTRWRRRGTASPCGSTATSPSATCSCATAGSPR